MKKLGWFLIYSFMAAAVWAVPVTDDLIIHVSADSLTLNDNDIVTSWPDLATLDAINGTLNTATNAANPVFKASGWNGFPSVKFARSSAQALESAQFSFDNTAGLCVFIVATGGTPDIQRAVQVGRRLGGNNKVLACELSSNQSGVRYGNGTALTAVGANPVFTGQWHISARQVGTLNARYDSLVYYVNNMNPLSMVYGSGELLTNFDVAANNLTVGNGRMSSSWRGTDWYEGEIAEVLVYNKLLTQQQIQNTMNYLTNKYNHYSAHNPSPANNAVQQGTIVGSNVQVTLGWTTGLDPANPAAPNPNVTSHYLYLVADEPNFAQASPIATIAAGSPVQATASSIQTLSTDKTYYWQVRESISGSAANDPNITIYGPVWKFTSLSEVPAIDTQPADQVVEAGQTATFSIAVTSISPVTYEWYKSVDRANNTAADDTNLSTNAPSYSTTAQLTTEGYYFCKATNAGGSTISGFGSLGVKRQIAHWTFDSADYVGGLYLDVCTEDPNDFPVDPNLAPVTGSIVPNSQYASLNEALDLTVEPMAAGWTKKVWAAAHTDTITVSAWIKWQGAEGLTANQGIVANQADAVDGGNNNNWFLEIPASNDQVRFNVSGTGGGSATGPVLPIGEWVHVAGSVGPAGTKVYVNGKTAATNIAVKALINRYSVPLYVGCSQRGASGIQEILNGSIDDTAVYNYQLDDTAIAQMYYNISNVPVCLNLGSLGLAFDIAGGGTNGDQPDCKVNLLDFAELANEWANCGLYPAAACP